MMNVEAGIHTTFDPFFPSSKENAGIDDLGDVSELLKQDLVEEEIHQEETFSSSLILNDQPWSCFDFTTVDSLEPTPIRPTESLSLNPQDSTRTCTASTQRVHSVGNFVPPSPTFSTSSVPIFDTLKLCHGPPSVDPVLSSSAPLSLFSKPARPVSARGGVDDSCYIRPSKIARMISNESISRPQNCTVASLPKDSQGAILPPKMTTPKRDVKKTKTKKASTSVSKKSKVPSKSVGKDRFRTYQNDQWNDRYQELKAFKDENGHCLVPHNYLYQGNPALAQWVKRQRFQYKQALQNKRTTITDERKRLLEDLGFIWDSHAVAWEEKYQSLLSFKEQHGHADVPSNYQDKNLAIWIKCQRRQYKLMSQGKQSAMTKERIACLEAVQFNWNPRNL